MTQVVIVGSSVAAVRTAQALRREGFDGSVTIVGAESHLPYDRPPLSKQFLRGDWEIDRFTLLSAEQARESAIELRLGVAASGLDTRTKVVVLEDGSEVAYDILVIATGASARPSPWIAASGVHVLRTLDDSTELKADLDAGGPVLIVGAGFIGAEVASTARGLGLPTIMVDPVDQPMERIVGAEVAHHFASLHTRHDVETHFGVGVDSIQGAAGQLTAVLSDGTELDVSTVVVGIGAVPNVSWLAGTSIELHNGGVLCDAHGRVDSVPDVYAVGDVSCWTDADGTPSRLEHWTNAAEQAAHVAKTIAGSHDGDAPFSPACFVWSDQHDWKIQVVGRPHTGTLERVDGDLNAHPARAVLVYSGADGSLAGAITVNWARRAGLARQVYARRGTAAELAG